MAKNRFTAPVGRMVQGSVDEPQTKDAQGALRVVKTGPNAGQPNPQYFIGVAYPKADPQGEFGQFYGMLVAQAAADFPALFPNAPRGDFTCVHPQFSFKVDRRRRARPKRQGEQFEKGRVRRSATSCGTRRRIRRGVSTPGATRRTSRFRKRAPIKRGFYFRV
jgi:hypothetical protein